MPIPPAENAFRKGMAALSEGDAVRATVFFESAMRIERERCVARPQMRYMSYYGLGLAMSARPTREAIQACEMAAEKDFYNVELQHNLGKVYLIAGKTTKGMDVLQHALRLAPTHKGLRETMAGADRRRQPPIRWLRRDHPLNHMLGRILYRLQPAD